VCLSSLHHTADNKDKTRNFDAIGYNVETVASVIFVINVYDFIFGPGLLRNLDECV